MPTNPNDMKYLNKVSLKKYYENSRNKIEDPLFTGFTLDIDTLHSPLFYTLAGKEYVDSLRSSDGTNVELSKAIEEKLADVYKFHIYAVPDSYEINTLYAKDTLGDRRAGYGLQDKYYIDNVLYGATDYIYMVDKVAIGTFSDDFGVTDLGNGTASSSVYEEYSNTLNDAYDNQLINQLEDTINSGGELESMSYGEAVDKEIELQNNGITDEIKNQHLQNELNVEDAEIAYLAVLKNKSYQDALKNIEDIESGSNNDKLKVVDELDGYKTKMQSYQSQLKGNGSKDDDLFKKIDSTYNEYKVFVQDTDGKYPNAGEKYKNIKVKLSTPKDKDINRELNDLSDAEKVYTTQFKQIIEVLKTTISERTIAETKKNDRADALKIKNEYEKKLYGVHNDNSEEGRIGSEENPAEPSFYYSYLKAKEVCDNDEYSQKEYNINKLKGVKDNLEDVRQYQINQSNKNKITKNLPSADHTGNKETKTEIYEVPQTVYDMMGFINGMKDIVSKYPYVLQSVTGLDEAYKKYFEVKDPYMGSGDDKITIECLEFLDLSVSSMFNKYFNAVYDRQYRRERVPINLRRFNCSIFVHDIRNFKNSLNADTIVAGIDLSTITEMALNYVSAIEFKFYDCEIVPAETGGIFSDVSNVPSDDMKKTSFTFTYGNCIINFLPFEDLRRYLLNQDVENIKPKTVTEVLGDAGKMDDSSSKFAVAGVDDGNFRRWFDKSVLGNVNNNDYRDYIRHDSNVAVDDHYKTTIVNDFAMNSVVNKDKQLTQMDDALRKIVRGISASTGIPVAGVTDALNIKFIDPIINEEDKAVPVVKNLGNVTNSKVVDTDTMEYIGKVIGSEEPEPKIVTDLGNVNDEKEKGGK